MSVFFDPFHSLTNEPFGQNFGSALSAGGDAGLYPDTENLLAWYRTDIVDGNLKAWLPPGTSHVTQQVKGSGFLGAGSATVAGLLVSDTITSSGPSDPICSVAGTLTFPGPDCWDIDVFRDGVRWASWKGINVSKDAELDASGNGHHLTALVTTTITERLDGTGSNWLNERGYSLTGLGPEMIPAVQDREMTYDSGVWDNGTGTTWIIGGGFATHTGAGSSLYGIPIVVGKQYRCRFTIHQHGGSYVGISGSTMAAGYYPATVGAFSKDFTATGVKLNFYSDSESKITVESLREIITYKTPASVRGLPSDIGRVVCIGDSLTNGYVGYISSLNPSTEFYYAGIGGSTSTQVAARFQADVVDAGATDCILLVGINDIIAGTAATAIMAKITECAVLCVNNNIRLMVSTLPPFGSHASWSSAKQTQLESFNTLLAAYCAANGHTLADLYATWKDPSTVALLVYYETADHLHPNVIGSKAQADLFSSLLPTTYSAGDAYSEPLLIPGPLGIDGPITGTTITAPLGPKFQAIDTFTNGAAVDLATLVPTTQVRTGPRGTLVYRTALDAAGIIRADRVVGYVAPEEVDLLFINEDQATINDDPLTF